MTIKRLSLTASAFALAAILAHPALAQDAPAAESPVEGLGDIVVTAQKRTSNAQSTPIAMTVASGEELAKSGVTDVNALANIAPTVNIAQNNANTLITIRGVSSRDYSETGDPAVAVSVDNFYLQRAFALNAALFDIDRIEVLRGPQGTLYGRNATAGAVNIASVKPTDDWKLDAAAEIGNYGTLNLDVGATIPVSDTLSFRVAGTRKTHEGYRNNPGLKDGDDGNVTGGRVHALWTPTDRLSILVTGEMTRVDGVGSVIKGIPYSDVRADGSLDIGSEKTFALNNQGYTRIRTKAVRSAISYDMDFATLSFFGGFQKSTLNRDNDQDGGLAYNYGFQQNEDVKDQNYELRLSSNNKTGFTWQLGGYFFKETDALDTFFQVHGDAGTVPFNFYTFDYDVGSKSKAVFAQVGYDLTDQLKVEAGVRYTKDNKYQVGYNIIAGTYSDLDNHYSGDQITWHAGLNYQATADSLIYAKVDKGYKAGGYTTNSSFGPETIVSYEVGTKNRFLNNALQVNLSGFYYDYSDLQTQQEDPATALVYTLNAGKARVWGAELETVWLVTPDTRIDANVAWLDAKYSEFCTITAETCPAASDLSGNRLTQAPEWTLSGGIQHDFHLLGGTLTPRVQTRYQTKTYFTFFNTDAEQQGAYWKSDAQITYTPDDGPFSITAYVRNIEDNTILTANAEAGYAGGYLVQFAAPRTYGARLSYSF
ncbi:TonB-dependent receptor [Novosphingobium sp. AP12]|uniref:TonB-dependent receptor n=1 Tax=Novosphingobium sp. AP12 TaxID=1144305 RepID=UPI000271D879|nr:TonB-dependent receptor [Novosphingobium sp. AP12]EJL33537.1 outer membrane receptor protein [Novosphingobium sp. AP12]